MVEEKIDKDGFIVTTQEESVPKEDREFAINVYSNNGEEICTVYTNNPTVARKYEKFIKSSPSSLRAARLFDPKRFTPKTENLLVSKAFLIWM